MGELQYRYSRPDPLTGVIWDVWVHCNISGEGKKPRSRPYRALPKGQREPTLHRVREALRSGAGEVHE